jgi:hypothetical protein
VAGVVAVELHVRPGPVRHRLIVRKVLPYHGRYVHVAKIRSPDDFDDDLRSWLTEAYLATPA